LISTNTNTTFFKVLFATIAFFAILQDLPTGNSLGTIARCPVFFAAPIFFLLLIVKHRSFKLHIVSKYFLYYIVITILTSLLMLIITTIFFSDGNMNQYGEFFPIKLVKAAQYNFLFFLFTYVIYNLVDELDLEFILKIFQSIFIFMVVYGCVETVIDYPLAFLHGNLIEEWKTRLYLTGPEPSTTMLIFSCIVFSTLIIRIYLRKKTAFTIIFALVSLVMLLGIGSKSGLAFLVISLLWVLRKNFSFKFLILAVFISIPIVVFIVNFVIPSLIIDVEEFASLSTRSTTMCVAIQSLFVFPLGQGYGTYIIHFPKMLLPMHKIIVDVTGLPLLDFEMRDMIITGRFLGVKSGILQEVLYNGIIAIVFFYFLFKNYFKQTKKIVNINLKMIFVFAGFFCLVELLFTSEYMTAYYFLFPFVILYKINRDVRLKSNKI
jgi:hypothetical protein